MREIKFRAFQDNQMLISPISSNYGLLRFFGMLYEDAKLMQFTGLKDKNGVDIYEGDIVNCIPFAKYDNYDYKNMYGVKQVVFNNDVACFYYDSFVHINWGGIQSYEVVGNIYENKLSDYDTEY